MLPRAGPRPTRSLQTASDADELAHVAGLLLLVAALCQRLVGVEAAQHDKPAAARCDRPDYVLRDFEVIALDKHGQGVLHAARTAAAGDTPSERP